MILNSFYVKGQKQLVEGVIIYNVTIKSSGPAVNTAEYNGTYTITVKGKQMRKEMKMSNGYDDVVVYDNNTNTVFSLKIVSGKKYAIQLDNDDYMNKIKKFEGYTLNEENEETKKIAGFNAHKATVKYSDGTSTDIYYTPEWTPANKWMIEHFPQIKYLPLSFAYNENEMVMHFKADKIEIIPVESSLFRIPADYKVISYYEYRQMNK